MQVGFVDAQKAWSCRSDRLILLEPPLNEAGNFLLLFQLQTSFLYLKFLFIVSWGIGWKSMSRWRQSRHFSMNASLPCVFPSLLITQMLTAFFKWGIWGFISPLYLEYSFNIFKRHIHVEEKLSKKKIKLIEKLIKTETLARYSVSSVIARTSPKVLLTGQRPVGVSHHFVIPPQVER